MFKGEHFDANAWAQLFKQAGARYVVPVAEHHDGFAMYDTAFSDWNAAKKGPQRDVLGELAAALREHDMILGASYHRAEHWWFFNGGRQFDSDVQDERYQDFYGTAVETVNSNDLLHQSDAWKSRDWTPRPDAKFLDDWLARCYELVDNYQPQLIYFDWWIEQLVFQPYLQKFAAYYYNRALEWGKEVSITYKFSPFEPGTAIYDLERGKINEIRDDYWQGDTSVSYQSWCYVEDDEFKTPTKLVHDLVDVVSKNGNLLLNVGPKPDGTIPDEAVTSLTEIGAWLDVNGEAIFGSRPWHVHGEGSTVLGLGHLQERDDHPFTAEDIRFTRKDDALYAICLGWQGDMARIRSLKDGSPLKGEMIEHVHMLGSDESLTWLQDDDGLHISAPSNKPCEHAFTFKISLKNV